MKPSFPLKYDALIQELLNRGSYSFEVNIENKENLRKAFNRCRRARLLMSNDRSQFGKLKFGVYDMYRVLLMEFTFRNDSGARLAVTYYSVALHCITSIEGKDLNETMTRVTFVAST